MWSINNHNNNIIIRYYVHRNIVRVTGVYYYYIIYMTCATQRFWHINKGAKLYYFTRAHTHNIIFKNIHTDILTYLPVGVIFCVLRARYIVYQKSRTVHSDFYTIVYTEINVKSITHTHTHTWICCICCGRRRSSRHAIPVRQRSPVGTREEWFFIILFFLTRKLFVRPRRRRRY